jgi:hypothetical protein
MESEHQPAYDREDPVANSESPLTNVARFLGGRARAKVVIAIFGVGILLAAAMLVSSFSEYLLIDRIVKNAEVNAAEIKSNDTRQMVLGLAWLVWYVATVVAFLMWVHRAHRNLPALGAVELEFTPWGAVGWYFAPFANLFKPYQCMREIYNASDPADILKGGDDWPRRNAPVVVKTWWAMFLLMAFFGNIVGRASLHADTPEAHQIVAAGSMIDDAITIVAILVAIWLVWSVDRRQEERAAILDLNPVPRFTIDDPHTPRL